MAVAPARPATLRGEVFRVDDVLARGLLTRRQLRSSAWRPVLRGVYADATLPVTHGLRIAAARLLMPPGAAVAGCSAAWLYGVDELAGPDDPVEVLVETAHRFGPVAGLRIRCQRLVRPCDVREDDGPRATTPIRTAWDLAADAPDLIEAVVRLDLLLRNGALRPTQLDRLDRHFLRRGCRRVPLAAALADGRAESPPESRLRVGLVLAGLPAPTPQYVVRQDRRFVARVDLAYPELKLAIEYDGRWHAETGQFARDRRRLNALYAAGWRVIHVTAADLYDLTPVVAAIRTALVG